MLKKSECDIYPINLYNEPFDEKYITNKINEINPDIIGLSVMYSHSEKKHIEVAKWIKKQKNKFIIAGGIAVTVSPDKFINNENIDAVCIGEGEYPMLELVEKFKNGGDMSKIMNLWVKRDGKIIKNKPRPLIQDLDALPFPDRDTFKDKKTHYICLMSGRGCPFQCTYCVNHTLRRLFNGKGNYIRRRSPENFIAEIKELKQKYNPETFLFHDDTFILDAEWIKKFCELYKKEKINIPFSICTNPTTIREDILVELKEAGLHLMRIGLESGDEHIRKDILKRNVDDKALLDFFMLVKKHNIQIKTYNIIGLPDETKEAVFKTIIFNLKINPEIPHFCYFQPFPNTELHSYCKEHNLIRKPLSGYHTEPTIETGHLKLRQVKKLYYLANFISIFNLKYPFFLRNKSDKFIKFCLNLFYYSLMQLTLPIEIYKKYVLKERI